MILPTPSAAAARTAGHASERRRVSNKVWRSIRVRCPPAPRAGSLRGKTSTSRWVALRRTCQFAACRETAKPATRNKGGSSSELSRGRGESGPHQCLLSTVQFCTLLYSTSQYCTGIVPYYPIKYCTVLWCTWRARKMIGSVTHSSISSTPSTVPHSTVLYCTVLCCTVLYFTLQYSGGLHCGVPGVHGK